MYDVIHNLNFMGEAGDEGSRRSPGAAPLLDPEAVMVCSWFTVTKGQNTC